MKTKFILGSAVVIVGLAASAAMACNCGKKSGTGSQVNSCQCGSSCTETVCSDTPVTPNQGAVGQGKKETESTAVDIGNKICPVSGKPIGSMGEGVTYTHDGKIYHLCCAGCTDKFKMELEYFIKKIETVEKINTK